MRAVVFSGTGDGRSVAEYLNDKKIPADVCVATDYGSSVMPPMDFVQVHTGRLDSGQMMGIIDSADFVIDATHPYAVDVSKNIVAACDALSVEYIRLLRDDRYFDDAVYADSIDDAVDYLKNTKGGIFVSTGSKELEKYCCLGGDRLTARVLPAKESMQKCSTLDINDVIYKMGPFDVEQNLRDFKNSGASWLVTKNSGSAGGLAQKIEAARRLGMGIIIIKRPEQGEGMTVNQVKKYIDKKTEGGLKFPLFIDLRGKNVLVVGGGKIGTRRIKTLLTFGARVVVVSPGDLDSEITGKVEHIQRCFAESDVDGMLLVVGATDSRPVNRSIYNACIKNNIPVSIADCIAECTFFFPAVCTDNRLSIGITSDGSRHGLVSDAAKKIRSLLNNEKNQDRQP